MLRGETMPTRSTKTTLRPTIRRLLLFALFVVLGLMPVAPQPVGAIQPLWAEAADLRAGKSYAAAVEVYEQIAALTPQDPEPLLQIGDIYVHQTRWPLAEDAFNRALARDGDNPRALAGLASARWGEGDDWRAVSLWQGALAHQPTQSDVRLRLAQAYLDLGQLAQAEATLRQELTYADTDLAHLYLAMILALDRPAQAREELLAIPDDGPQAVVAARDYVLAAIEGAEGGESAAGAARSLGLAFVQIGEWQLARVALERALRLDPANAEAMAFLGHAEAQLSMPAFDHLSGAVEAEPDWPLGHYFLGRYYVQHEAYELAVGALLTALQLDSGNLQARIDLAQAYIGLGKYLEAEETLVAAVELAPKDVTIHLALVHFYADHTFRVADRGLSAARAAADLAPQNPQARDLLGWMYFLAGNAQQARLNLNRAISLDQELVSAHYHLGLLHRAMGEEDAARLAFLRVVDLDTEGFYRDRALTMLAADSSQ
jgi:tetratricopeptide (TPR) repeat protein